MTHDRAWLAGAWSAAVRRVQPQVALAQIDPTLLDEALAKRSDGGRLRLIAIGKAAGAFARAFVASVPVDDGIVIAPPDAPASVDGLIDVAGDHPVPCNASLAAAERLFTYIGKPAADDRYVVLLTGGASALCVAPIEGVTLEQKRAATLELMRSGASIAKLNQLRRQLSRIKGGGLARYLAPAQCLTLAISDVEGDDPAVIGSAPTVAPELASAGYVVIATLDHALQAVRDYAAATNVEILDVGRTLYGTVEQEATRIATCIRQCRERVRTDDKPILILAGGEPVISIRGDGRGGRAQHLALLIAAQLQGLDGVTALVAGTDGIDGPTTAAGAFVDGASVARLQTAGFDIEAVLAQCDSHSALSATGDLWVTGRTDTNVADLLLVLIRPGRMSP